MKYDVYINTSVSVYDVEAKTEKEAQSKALKLMLKQIRQKDPSIDTEQVQHLRINYVMDSDDWYPTHGGNND
tara:strand:+ start:203 stop:418 length:216 start_codon:yes stop_codon:yes gene_type:complete